MADLVFNIAKGKAAYLAGLPLVNDALIVVPLEATGLPTDATLRDLTTLAAIKLQANEQTTMGRKTINTGVTVTPDNVNDRVDVDFADFTWPSATGNPVGAVVVCYDADTTGGTDADLIPLTKHDFAVTPSGVDIVAQVAASGFYRAV